MLERRLAETSVPLDRRSDERDRRIAQRYRAGGTCVVLTWTEDDEYRTIAATLRDLSLGGGSALAGEAPPKGTLFWFRLGSDRSSQWIGAHVVGVSRTGILGRGPRLIRWRFRESCPYQIFKSAIEGFSQAVQILEYNANGPLRRDRR
jgi:hypothetical protein